jgi:hypothetical protein
MSDRLFEQLPYYSKTDQAIYEASRKNTRPLVDYLLSDKPLDSWDRLKLAYLIDRFLGAKKHGHPHGRTKIVLPHLNDDAERFVARQVKNKLAEICTQSGRRTAPKGKADELIAIAVAEAKEWEYPELGIKGLKLSAAQIKAMVERGSEWTE